MMGRKLWTTVLICAAVCAALWTAPVASAGQYLPPRGTAFVGVTAGSSIAPFEQLVRYHPPVFERFMSWDTNTDWLAATDSTLLVRRGISLTTAPAKFMPGVVSPEGISLGRSDAFLVAMNQNLARSGRITYVRIMPEMNGWWNSYCPFNQNGTKRGKAEWPRFFIAAWRRTVLILRGGPVREINRKLHALHMPPVKGKISKGAVLPYPKVAFMWVPMTRGGPEIPQLEPQHFWPGSAYVDWVGTDTFSPWVRFNWLNEFYRRFTGKPFEIAEWAVMGRDDPGFVRAMFTWVRRHPRVRMFNYYQGYAPTDPYNPINYPKSVAVLHHELISHEFPQYAPEFLPRCGPRLRLRRLCAPGR